MIWHIFKKDLKLTWRLAAAVAALHWTTTILMMWASSGGPAGRRLQVLLSLLVIGGWLASGFLISAAVHHDAIPGVRQDWLVRPIRRRDLMLAKLVFAVLAVELPIFMADFTEALLSGFSPASSLNAGFQRSLTQMLLLNLAFLAFAAVTRNLLEAVTGGVALGFAAAIAVGLSTSAQTVVQPVIHSGLEWIGDSAMIAALMMGAAAILALQYFRRRTAVSRVLTGLVTALLVVTSFMPWQPAYAIQRSFSPAPGSSQALALDFDRAAGRFRMPAGALMFDDALVLLNRREGQIRAYLPLRVSGLPPDSAVVSDYSELRLVEGNGRAEALAMDAWNARGTAAKTVYPPLGIPADVYKRIKDQPVRIEAEYWLTLVQVASSHALPAIDGDQRIPGVGWCRTRFNDQETAVQLGCLQAGLRPVCTNFFLEHLPTGQRNPDRFGCSLYTPFILNPLSPDALWRFGANLPFRDVSSLARYPVDGSKLRDARAVIQVYRVRDHFTRKLTIPNIRLADWSPAGPGA